MKMSTRFWIAGLVVVTGFSWLALRGDDERPRKPHGVALAGVVSDTGAHPLAGAELRLVWIGADAEPAVVATGRAGADGRYQLRAARGDGDGVLVLMAAADGHETAGRRIDPKVATQDFVLVPGAVEVTVQVADAAGPVGGADVMLSIEPAAGDPDALTVATVRTGGDGRAVFAHVTRGAALLHYSARAPGRGRAFGSQRKADGDAVILAQLVPGAVVTGTVVGANGAPVLEDVALAFAEQAGPWGDHAVARGGFRVADVPVGVGMTVRVQADGYLLADGQDQMTFTVPAGAAHHELAIAVQPAGQVTGQVRSRGGEPIEGAVVEATPSDHRMAGRRVATTDPDGRFRIGGLRLDAGWDLDVRHPDFAPGFVDNTRPARGGTETSIALIEGGAISGRVRMPAGGVEVYAHRIEQTGPVVAGLREHVSVAADRDGGYVVEHLNPGRYRVELRRAARMAWAPTAAKVLEVTVSDGETTRLDDAVLEGSGAIRVQPSLERDRAAGQTLEVSLMKAGARGAPQRLTVQTGDAGDAVVPELEPGRYDVVVRVPALGYARADGVEVTAGATATAKLALAERIVLEGRVRRPDGTPAAGAAIEVYLDGAGSQADYSLPGRAPDNFTGNRAIADDAGRFRIAGLAPGAAAVRVTLDGEAPLERSLTVGPHPAALTLDLVRPASCEVSLVDADDRPLADKIILAQRTAAPRHVASAVTDAHGRVRFDHVPPGPYQLRAIAGGDPRGQLVVAAGETGRVVLKAPN